MGRAKVNGLVNFQGALSLINRDLIIGFTRANRVPAIYQSKLFATSGGLMAYAPDQDEQFREAARYVDQILRGMRPGDLPIRHPARYFLTLNRSAAASIGLVFPREVLAQADTVIH
jgi:putative ABC transport system substrate-binding protein